LAEISAKRRFLVIYKYYHFNLTFSQTFDYIFYIFINFEPQQIHINKKRSTLVIVDETNIQILKHLKDGRKSFKIIADDLSLTENTIRSRVNKLLNEGILDFSGNVQIDALPGHTLLYLGVKLKSMELQKKAEEFSKLRGVVSAGIVTGRYDIILQVLLGQDYTLLEFITEQVAKVIDVQTVESFIVYKGYNLKVPYIL